MIPFKIMNISKINRFIDKTLYIVGESFEDLLNNRTFQDIATWAGCCYLFYYFTK